MFFCEGWLSLLLGENAKLVACMTCGCCVAVAGNILVDVMSLFDCFSMSSSSRDVFINNAEPVKHVAAAMRAVIHMVEVDEDENGGIGGILIIVVVAVA